MAKEIIEIEVKTGKAVKETDKLKKSVEETNDQFKSISKNAKEFEKDVEGMKTDRLSSIKGHLGGAVQGFKSLKVAIISSGIGAIILGIVGAFKFLQEAIGRSEKASESFGKIMAKVTGFFNGLIAVVTPVIELFAEGLVNAIEKPKKTWSSFVETLSRGWQFVKNQVVDRFVARWDILSGVFQKGVLKMRIAWNEFTGDSKEADQLKTELEEVNNKVEEAIETINKRNQEIIDGFNSAVSSVKEFGKEAVENYNKASEASERLANSERRLVKNRIAMEKQQLTSLRLAEEQRQIRDDISRSIEDRIQANAKLGQILDNQLKRELSLAQQQLSLAKLEQQASGDTIENLERVGEAELKILEIRERITGQRSEQLVNEQALIKEREDLANEQAKIEEEKQIEEIEKEKKFQLEKLKQVKAVIDEFNRAEEEAQAETEVQKLELQRERQLARLALIQEGLNAESEAYKLAEEQRKNFILASDKAIQEAKDKDAKQEILREKLLQQQKIGIVGQTFGQLAQILGENSALGKASAVAQATINTYQGITEVWSTKSALPEPFATISRIASTATVLASGLSAVKQIKKQKLPSSPSSGGGGGGSSVTSAPAPQQAQFNIVGSSPINQLAQTIGEQTNQPQQAYVVSGEISTAQDLENNIIESASIGG